MRAAILAVIALFAIPSVVPAFHGTAEAQDPGRVVYNLVIDCPQARQGAAGTTIRCPIRAEDAADMMGSPSVAVDIRNPNLLVMASLHGQDAEGPSVRSRQGLPYTTFTSTDAGRSWRDNYFPGPADVRGSFGEHPQIVTDPYGHVYIGSLWARPIGGSTFQYILSAQKFETLSKVNENQVRSQGSYNVQYIDPLYKGSAINQYYYVFNPRTDNMTVLWHETPSPLVAPTSTPSDATTFHGFQDRPALRHAHAHAATPATVGIPPLWKDDPVSERFRAAADDAPLSKFVIAYAWTNMTMKSRYHYALEENVIGPCIGSTNPVWSEGWTYVGCVTNPDIGPFKWNENTTPGRVEIFRFQPETGLPPEYLGASPISTGAPKLGVRSDGRLALFSTDVVDGKLQLLGAFGKYKAGSIDWSKAENYASTLPSLGTSEIVSANIQDLEFREYSGAVHLILKEEVVYLQVPGIEGITPPAGPRYRKTLFAIDERYGYLDHYRFDIGAIANRTDPTLFAAREENYNDLSDDIVQLPPRPYEYNGELLDDLYQREFFAVGDYGIIIFAEIIELTDLRPPGVPPGPPGPPPVAAPALATTPSMVLLPMAGTTFAGLLAFALLANRRKNPLAAITKGE